MLPFPLRENAGSFEETVVSVTNGNKALAANTRTNLFTLTNVYTSVYPDIMAGLGFQIESSATGNITLYLNVNGTDLNSTTFSLPSGGYYRTILTGLSSLPAGSQLTVKVDALFSVAATLTWEYTFIVLATIIIAVIGSSLGGVGSIANSTFYFTTALKNEIDRILVLGEAVVGGVTSTNYTAGLNVRTKGGAVIAAMSATVSVYTPTAESFFASGPSISFMPVPPDRTSTYSVNTADGISDGYWLMFAVQNIVVQETSIIVQ